MIGFAGALVSLVIVQVCGDTIDGRSVRASWRRSAMLIGAFILIAAGGVTLGRLLR